MTATVHGPVPQQRPARGWATDLRLEAHLDVEEALASDQLELHLQPMLELSTGEVVGAEGLLRWRHPERGLLAPGAFLAHAEAEGFGAPIAAAVLDQACRAATGLAATGTSTRIAVNVSPLQLARTDVPALVAATLSRHGLPGSALLVELTETAVLADVDRAAAALHALRDLGVGVYLDDFGTGCSSLSLVKLLPVTGLKLDRSFVAGVTTDRDDRAIAACVIGLAEALQLDCVAEGVETAAQRDALAGLGCATGQGFLWSPALPSDELAGWLDGRVAEPASTSCDAAPRDAVAERIAELHREGTSVHTIAALLNSEGLRAPTGLRWHGRSVSRVLLRQAG